MSGAWISQTLTTVAGQAYTLSFYYDAGVGSGVIGNTTELDALWNGSLVSGGAIVNAAGHTWAQYSFPVVATGTSTVLEFTGRQDFNPLYLTSISVAAVILPATSYTMTGPTGGAIGSASTNFTVTPNSTYSGTITITPSGGGLSTPLVLTFSSATAQTFSITPTAPGPVTLTPSNNGSLTNPATLTYITPPSAPTIGTATAGSGSASVAFTVPVATGGSPITFYTASCSPGSVAATGTASPITVSGLTAGTTYACSVIATNSVGPSAASAASNQVTIQATGYTLTGPAGGLINAVSNVFTITPNAAFTGTITITLSGGPGIASIVRRAGGAPAARGGPRAAIVRTFTNSAAPQTFTITPTGVGPVIITATNNAGLVDPGALSYATPPGAPMIGTATPGGGSLVVSFTPPASGGSAILSYTATCTGGATAGTASGTGTSSPITVGGVTDNMFYTCTVTASNSFGVSAASNASNGALPLLTATPAPSTLGLLSIGAAALFLWNRRRLRVA